MWQALLNAMNRINPEAAHRMATRAVDRVKHLPPFLREQCYYWLMDNPKESSELQPGWETDFFAELEFDLARECAERSDDSFTPTMSKSNFWAWMQRHLPNLKPGQMDYLVGLHGSNRLPTSQRT